MIQPIGHKKLTRTHHHDMYRGLGGQDVQLSLPPQKKYLWLDGDVQVKRDFTHKEKNAETQTNH